jgi:cytochrome P450
MRRCELRAEGWLASGPFGYIVLDRESAEFFLRTRAASFPGMKIAEIFEVSEGPTFPEGTIVMVCAFTGNRDLDEGTSAGAGETFDITAERGRARALTFGAGVHHCLGANLARLELSEALTFLAGRFSRLELDGEPEYESIMGIYGLAKLPVRFTSA